MASQDIQVDIVRASPGSEGKFRIAFDVKQELF